MPNSFPMIADQVICPTDRTAANPPVSFGGSGSASGNSGSGVYGSYSTVNLAVAGADILKANANGISLTNSVYIMNGAGAPTDAVTGATFAEIGSLYIDKTAGKLYINTGTKASPTWTVVGTQS